MTVSNSKTCPQIDNEFSIAILGIADKDD